MCDAYWFRSENCTQRDQQSTKGQAKLLMARTQLAGRWATAAQYVTLLMQPATWAKNWRRGDCSILFLDLKHVYIDYHDCCMHVLPNWKGVRKGSTAELLVCPVFCETANYRNIRYISLCAYTASQHSTNQQNGCGMPQHHSSKQWQNLSSTALIAARTRKRHPAPCSEAKAATTWKQPMATTRLPGRLLVAAL